MQRRLLNVVGMSVVAIALMIAAVVPSAGQTKQPENAATSMPKVGDMAPDFTLKYFDGKDLKDVSLSEYRGKKNVVVGFFIFAFTGG